jgi:hypothetical protein
LGEGGRFFILYIYLYVSENTIVDIHFYCRLPSVFFLGVLIGVFLGDETGVLFLGFLVEELVGEQHLKLLFLYY